MKKVYSKRLTAPTVLIVLLVMASAMASAETPKDYYVRIDIRAGIRALTDVRGNLTISFSEESKTVPIAVDVGKYLEASHTFAGALNGAWSIEVESDGKITLLLQGEVNGTSASFTQTFYDKKVWEIEEDKSSIMLTVGSVAVKMKVFAKMREAGQWTVTTAFDLNRNGELEPNETSRIDVRGSIVNISSPTVSGVPLTATYGLNVSTGERNVITIAGLYDYVFGKAIRGESWTDDTVVESYVARLSYIPNMAPLELNNSEIVHKLVTAPIVAQDTYEAIIGGGEVVSSRPPPARGVVFVKAVDFDEKPLVDVNVTVLSGEKVVESRVTDLNGLTSFSLEAGNYTLKVQKDGFEPVELSVTIEANKETTVSITLEKKPSIIEEFLIQSKLFITKYWLPLTAISIVLVAIAIIVRRRH